jgi:3-keto-disaccharide hydrolase
MSANRLAVASWIVVLASAVVVIAAEPIELFNGKDLSGWKRRGGAAKYSAEDGAIVGRSVPNTSNTFLTTEKEYGDFELELDFKIDDPTFNSGVQIRSHARPKGDGEVVYGYQIEIDPRADRAWTGGLYFEAGSDKRPAGWLQDLTKNEAARKAFKLGQWNHLKIVTDGRHIQSWLNGVPAADYTDTNDAAFAPSGFIGLQVHAVGDSKDTKEVRWRNIKLTPADSSHDATGE